MLDEDQVLELIQSGSFEAKDYVNKKQSYDDIRHMLLKLMDEDKLLRNLPMGKMMLEAIIREPNGNTTDIYADKQL